METTAAWINDDDFFNTSNKQTMKNPNPKKAQGYTSSTAAAAARAMTGSWSMTET